MENIYLPVSIYKLRWVLLRAPCEIASRYILPALRAMVAVRLVRDYGLSQVEVAKKLGTTQPAISYYLRSLRGVKSMNILSRIGDVQELVDRFAGKIAAGEDVDVEEFVCRVCRMVRGDSRFLEALATPV